jgi:hypothetical protein
MAVVMLELTEWDERKQSGMRESRAGGSTG